MLPHTWYSKNGISPHVTFPWLYHHNFLFSSRVWDVNTGEVLNTLIHHNEAVLHLRFSNGLMVTCSKDRSIAVWDMASATDITLRRVLVGHRAAVNVVDFDDKYIVSASGDRTIKVSVSAVFILTVPSLYSREKAEMAYTRWQGLFFMHSYQIFPFHMLLEPWARQEKAIGPSREQLQIS